MSKDKIEKIFVSLRAKEEQIQKNKKSAKKINFFRDADKF